MQLIVLGIQDSAVAFVTRILHMMGAYFGPEGAPVDNILEGPLGNWERQDLRELSNTLMSASGAAWDRIADFDIQKIPKGDGNQFVKKVASLILELDGHRPWVINEPKMCLLLPLLRPLLEAPLCIMVNRFPLQIAKELQDFYGFPINVGMALWEKYTLSAMSATVELPKIFVSFEETVKDPLKAIEQLYGRLCEHDVQGLRLPQEREIQTLIQKEMNRLGEPEQIDPSFVNTCQKCLFEIMQRGNSDQLKRPPSLSMEAIETLFQFEDKANFEGAYKKKCVEFTEQRDVLDAEERENRIFKRKIDERDAIIQANNHELMDVKKEINDTKKEMVLLRKENKSLEIKLQEQASAFAEKGRELEDSFKTMKKVIVQYKSDLDETKKDLAASRDEMTRIKTEVLIYEKELRVGKEELQSAREERGMAFQETESLQKEILNYKRIQRETETTLRSRDNYLKTVESSLEHEKSSIYKLTRWIEKLDSDFNSFKQSKRCIVGNGVVRMLEIMLFRKRVPIAMDHIGEMLLEFSDWRSSGSKKKSAFKKPTQ